MNLSHTRKKEAAAKLRDSGSGQPIPDIEDCYKDIFWEMVNYAATEIMSDITNIGLDVTDDCIVFCQYHDMSEEESLDMIKKTVNEEIFLKLLK